MRIIAAIIALVLLASPAYGSYRVIGFITLNGQRVLVVQKTKPKQPRRVIYNDPLERLWRTSPGGDTRWR